jgi:uncharacterized protein
VIIDFHYHYPMRKITEAEALGRVKSHLAVWYPSARLQQEETLEEMAKTRVDFSDDADCAKMMRRMEAEGIDMTVLLPLDQDCTKTDEVAIMAYQKACADVAAKNPKKLIAFSGINPCRKNAPDLFRKCILEYGMKGLKWHPGYSHFDPTSPECYKVLQVAQELNVPLLIHTGTMYGICNGKFCRLDLLDQMAADFPGLKIVGAHMGHLAWQAWQEVAYFKRNFYGDLSEWQILAAGNYDWFCRTLREIIDLVGVDRILFATDGPYVNLVVSNTKWLKLIHDLPRTDSQGIRFTQDEVNAILGGNAQKLLGM